jgi:hypothetical protein
MFCTQTCNRQKNTAGWHLQQRALPAAITSCKHSINNACASSKQSRTYTLSGPPTAAVHPADWTLLSPFQPANKEKTG